METVIGLDDLREPLVPLVRLPLPWGTASEHCHPPHLVPFKRLGRGHLPTSGRGGEQCDPGKKMPAELKTSKKN